MDRDANKCTVDVRAFGFASVEDCVTRGARDLGINSQWRVQQRGGLAASGYDTAYAPLPGFP
jgi:hypothetical protein